MSNVSIIQLKHILKKYGLPTTGKKSILVSRINEYENRKDIETPNNDNKKIGNTTSNKLTERPDRTSNVSIGNSLSASSLSALE